MTAEAVDDFLVAVTGPESQYREPAAAEFFKSLGEHTIAMPKPLAFIPAGADVTVWGSLQGTERSTKKPNDLAIVHLWTVKDGLIIRFAAYIDTPGMQKALSI